ncbi:MULTISPECIES: TIGR03084 family metal-binding protein [Streptomyces]|uniref:TIGR03084 family metal-binding protein n=1 Tax=Streptomyces TaxID=1883 RepID=UPI0004C691A6|nr:MULTISPECIES: TIGR03084 family metal-binding protein [Streptomyces]MDX2918369.1 TIGR03084 family metal-binding protein [Streptomyces sp. NE06-03C]MDX3606755.1 TIGR03084 family metal-binding protein [Streptomyces sp. FL06-04B]MDX3739558.1 TIGR03084 family metal-binding protein [Streptomyces sp. ID01-15D]
MNTLDVVLKHLATDIEELAQLVEKIDDDAWTTPTPAPGWTVTDQIAHLTFVFNLARTAAAAPSEFKAVTAAAAGNFDGAVNAALEQFKGFPPRELLTRFRDTGRASVEALAAVPADQVVPWLVNPLPPVVLGCAGIMEVFAHGQDVADALGVRRTPTERLRNIVDFAWLTRDFGYESHGLTPPAAPFRFELTAPSGEVWTVGPQDADETISGPAHDFCLLVTRRRHRDDLALTASGQEAEKWLDIAQAYRGPAGEGRRPGQFAATGS